MMNIDEHSESKRQNDDVRMAKHGKRQGLPIG